MADFFSVNQYEGFLPFEKVSLGPSLDRPKLQQRIPDPFKRQFPKQTVHQNGLTLEIEEMHASNTFKCASNAFLNTSPNHPRLHHTRWQMQEYLYEDSLASAGPTSRSSQQSPTQEAHKSRLNNKNNTTNRHTMELFKQTFSPNINKTKLETSTTPTETQYQGSQQEPSTSSGINAHTHTLCWHAWDTVNRNEHLLRAG